jgi:hypothetical protein
MAALPMSRYLGISFNAALRMKHKIQMVMGNADDSIPLTQLVQVDDVYWSGKKQGCKKRG